MLLRIIILSTLILVVMSSAQYYLERRLLQSDRDVKPHLKWSLRFCFALIIVSLPARFFGLNDAGVIALFWITYLTLGFYALVFLITLTLDMIGRIGTRIRAQSAQEATSETLKERRAFLSQGLALPVLGTSASGSAYGIYNTRTPELITVDIYIPRLPAGFEGYRIVQISDLHVGLTIRERFARSVVELALAQTPDAIALTGDLLDGTFEELHADIKPLEELTARDGIYYCTGNHEYYSGAEPWVDYFRGLGWRCLMNEHEIIERVGDRIAICGVTDRSAHTIIPEHRSDPQKALRGLDPELCTLLLAHQPKSVYDLPPRRVDLVLSGHTHGGQFFPWSVFVKLVQPYLKGLYRHDERTQLYVNQGTGYWGPPLRVGTTCEVTLITLRGSAHASDA